MDNFLTQSSIKDYLNCNYKYKLKHIDKLYWFQDEFQPSLDLGTDFHSIAERYFLGLDNLFIEDSNLIAWLEELQNSFPKNPNHIYLPEYEMQYNEFSIKLFARYDLLILTESEIIIVDWKTNKKMLNLDKTIENIQTKVYLFLLANCLSLFPDKTYNLNSIKMIYWQPNYSNSKLEISYSFEKHLKYKDFFIQIMEDIGRSAFKRNGAHCKICEFNIFCNN